MNEEIFNLWLSSGKCVIKTSEEASHRFFFKYMDKHSLRLKDFSNNTYYFTNDAQTIQFTSSEIMNYVAELKQGKTFPWAMYDV